MRLLIFSDIHSNLEALQSIVSVEKYDKALFLGDVVDYGPDPAETLDLVLSEADYLVQGNHDLAAATGADCQCAQAMHDLSVITREEISSKLLSPEDKKKLEGLKALETPVIDGRKFMMVHASPNNHLYGYMFSTEAEMVWKKAEYKEFDYITVGHTHFPMLYRGRIVNPGSAGQPRDGFWKPMYAVLDTETGDLTFKRFEYDRDKMLGKLSRLLEKYPTELQRLKELYI